MNRQGRDPNKDVYVLAGQLQAEMEAAVSKPQKATLASAPVQETKPTPAPGTLERIRNGLVKLWRVKTGPPDISIVIPVHNKAAYTLNCLESLSKHASRYSFEVIIVDNASTDETAELVGIVPGIRYLRNSTNRGFVDGCNDGVAQARGKIIVLLNNDTVVLGNWLDALADRLTGDASIGLVGSKLIYPDGRLQEAGGIIFSDGSCYNFGKNKMADDFDYNYCRDVDYCSGASIAFSREDFVKLGSFDRRFAPAYYEDADLAMSMRHRLGKRVVYEPYSVLVHVEGVTAGTDINSGYKKYQSINQAKFVKKWRKQLAGKHYAPDTKPLIAARHGKSQRLLIVDSIVPEYDRDSGSLRMFQIIKAAVKLGYSVTLFANNRVATQPYTGILQAMGIEVVYGAGLTLEDFYQRRTDVYDVIILSRPTTAIWHLEYCAAFQPNARLIYDTVDLHFLRIGRQAKIENSPKLFAEADKWQQLEYYLMDHTDVTLVVSYEEEKLLQKQKPDLDTFTVSNINPQPDSPEGLDFAGRAGLLFVADYKRAPNYSAARWFAKDIFPLVRKELPEAKLTLLGSNPEAIHDLAGPSVVVTGFVEDVDPYFHKSRVFICPLRYGAGVKGKVSQSIAFGLPVISTDIGIEGMHLNDGDSCLVAETPVEFAKQVVRLYNDQKLWNKISKNSLVVYDKYFSETAGLRAVEQALRVGKAGSVHKAGLAGVS